MKTFYVVAEVLSHEHKNPSGSTIMIRRLKATHYVDWDGNKYAVKEEKS